MEAEVLNISPLVVWAIALSQLLTFGLTIWNMLSSGARAKMSRRAPLFGNAAMPDIDR